MCQEARDNVLDAISVANQKNLIKDVQCTPTPWLNNAKFGSGKNWC